MKTRRRFWITLAVIAVTVLLWLFLWRRPRSETIVGPQPQQPSQASTERQTPASATTSGIEKRAEITANDPRAVSLLAAYATPITFYGKVVDEVGNPVPAAKIKLGAADNPAGDGSYHYQTSDRAGRFELHGARGLGVAVWVSKEGYYTTEAARGRNFVYGGVRGANDPVNPTPDNPAIFVLKKMGEAAPLVYVARKSLKMPKDGTPVEIDLSTGRVAAAGTGHLRVEVWTANQGMDSNKSEPYEWEVRVSVPGGGLVERVGEYTFEAPETGYAPAFETGMQKNAERWRDGFQKEFFAKLGNGQFARFYLRLLTSGDHFVALESYLNPTPGSRNLEFDPAKAIASLP